MRFLSLLSLFAVVRSFKPLVSRVMSSAISAASFYDVREHYIYVLFDSHADILRTSSLLLYYRLLKRMPLEMMYPSTNSKERSSME